MGHNARGEEFEKPFHTCPYCKGNGADMQTAILRTGPKSEFFPCQHEKCAPWFNFQACYEIRCICGESVFLCERHGEWEATPRVKGRPKNNVKLTKTDRDKMEYPEMTPMEMLGIKKEYKP